MTDWLGVQLFTSGQVAVGLDGKPLIRASVSGRNEKQRMEADHPTL